MFERFRSRSQNGSEAQVRRATMPAPAIRALEPRFVFDGAAAPAAAQAQSDAAAQSHGDQADTFHAEPTDRQAAAPAAASPGTETASADGRHEIVVIDKRVADLQTLLAGVPASAEVILIDSGRDGFDQLADALKGRSDIDAIHILSHGAAGDLRLGTGDLTAETIQGRYAADLAIIGRALNATGDLLIYGCDFAAGETGARAAALLAQATGADVAASNDATGDTALGGDWDLEVHDGAIESGVVIGDAAQREWHHLLATAATITVSGDPVVRDGAGNTISTTRDVSGANYRDVDNNVLGATAFWANAGTVGGVNVSLRATVVAIGESDDAVSFATSASGGDASVLIRAQAATNPAVNHAASITIRWDLVRADNPSVAVMADVDFQIGDIDGIGGQPNTRESVTPSQTGLTSYTLASTTDLLVDSSNDRIRVSGTQDETASPPNSASIVRFNWTDVSSWQVTYDLASNATTGQAAFQHDGDRSLAFTPGTPKTVPKVDLDGNDSSGATGTDYRTSFTEKGSAVAVVDTDPLVTNTAAMVSSATVTLTNAQAGDRLNIGALPNGITATPSTGSGTITVTLSGDADPATYQAALQAITFENTSGDPSTTDRIVRTHVTSDGIQGTSATTTVAVVAVDDAPVLDLDASSAGTGYTTSYTEGGAGIAIVDTDVSVADVDNTTMVSARVAITNGSLGDRLSVAGTLPSNIGWTFDPTTYTLALTGTATKADYQTALQQIRFLSTSDDPASTTRSIAVTVNDGALDSNIATTAVAFTAVNDAPVNGIPAAQSVNEDNDLVFSTANANRIAVSDVDAGGGSLTTTLSVLHGTLTLGGTANVTVSGNGTGTVTLSGTVADINTALNGTVYRAASNYNGGDTLTMTTDDGGNTGTGGALRDTDTVALTFVPVADPPRNTAPAGTQSATEDTPLVFSSTNGNAVSVTDVDGNGLTVTLSSTRGTLTLSRLTGLTFTVGDGTGDAAMTFSGSQADINAALEGLRFDPSADYNGSADIALVTRGPTRTADNFTNGGFENPVIAGSTFQIVPDSSVPGWKTDATDRDIEIWKSGYNGVAAYEGNQFAEINANQVAALFQTFDAAAGSKISLDFAHRGRQGVDTMQVLVTDLGADGTLGTADDAVLLDKTYADGNTAWGAYHEDLAQSASGNTLRFEFRSISAAGGSQSIGNFVDGIRITQSFEVASNIHVAIAAVPDIVADTVATDEDAGITFNALTGTNGASADTFEDPTRTVTAVTQGAHGSVVFQPDGTMTYTPPADFNGVDSFTYTVTSGGTTETATVTVTVRPVNDAPVNGLPAAQAVNEDADLVFSTANANRITVSDIDAGGGSLTTTLSVLHGTLTVGGTANVTVSGSGTGTLTLTGTVADINAALDGTTYRGTADYNGPDTLTVTTDDQGNSGSGGAKSDTDSVTLTVRPVEDPPTNSVPPATQGIAEDTPLIFSAGAGNGIRVADPDGGTLTVTLSSTQGRLTLSRTAGLTFLQGDGSGDGTMRFSGAIADINAALEGLRFDPTPDLNGPAQIALTTQDPEGATASSTIAVTIAPVADIVPDLVATDEDTAITFNALTGTNGASADNFEDLTRVVTAATQGAHGSVSFQPDGTMTYTPEADFNGTDSFTYTVTSGGTTETATVTVTVRAVNDAPVNGMPTDQSLAEDTPLVFSAANGNRISVSDADAQNGAITTTLSVLHGTLTLGSTTGVTVLDDGSNSVTLTGTVDAINAALDGITYRPAADYNGGDTLTVLTDDNGNTGSGGAQTDTDTIGLTIAPVNDAPRAGVLPAIGSLEGDAVAGADLGRYFSDVEGDRLTFTSAGLPPGLAIDAATGTVSGTIDRSASRGGAGGDYAVTITADDGNGGVTNRTFVWRVVNPAPIALNDGIVVDAATPATGSVLADNGNGPDSDPDSDPLGVAAVNGTAADVGQPIAGSAGGRFVVLADGRYRFDPGSDFADLAPGETRTTRITYTIADGDGGTAEASVAVTVTGRNIPPATLAPDDRAAADGQSVALPLGSLFADPEGQGLRFGATGLPPGLSIDPATGAVTGTIDHVASGASGLTDYRITIVATDPQGATTERSFTFRVTNPPPQAVDDRATTVEDIPITIDVLANDRDADGDTLTILAASDAAPSAGHGRVTVVGGRLSYTPDPNFNGTDTITYTIADGNGGTSTASVTVTVSPADDAPDAGILPDQFGRDGAPVRYDISSRFHDADTDPSVIQAPTGDSLRFTATGLPPGLSIDPATGLITGTLSSDASAASRYAVTITATDAAGASVARSFTWTVSNAAPLAAPDTAITREGAMVLVTVTANDIDPDGDAIRLVDEPGAASAGHGSVTVDPATGLLAYTPEPGFTGRDTIVYTIADAQGARATGILTVTVTPVNDRPVAPETLPGRHAADGESVRVPLGNLIADPDGDRLAYSATGLPPGLSIDPATGEITGTIDRAASGPSGRATYVVTLTATDPGGLAVTRSFAWTVTNPAPTAVDDAITTAEDTPVDIDVTANDSDPDGDPLTVVPGSMTAGHGTVTLNPDGSLRYVPDRDFNGTDRIVYTITDGNGGFATASATITVTPVNDAPTVDPSSPALADRSANDAQTVSIPAGSAFGDIDAGDRLSFSATGLPPGLTVDPATGLISGTIVSDASSRAPGGVYTIVLTATDTGGASVAARLTITVANPAPIATDDDATLAEDNIFTGSVLGNDRDPDGDALRVDPVPVAGPAHGRLDLRPDGTFTYTPDADFHGTDAFTYALIDSDGGRATATVHLTVDSVNDVPTATSDPLTLPANTIGTGRIVAADRDGDALSFRLTEQPVNGTLTLAADGSYAYKPYAAFSGTDSFIVEVSDGQGGRTLVTVAITITPNPVQVPPSAMIPILAPAQPFPDRPAAPPPLASAITANGIVLPAVAEIETLGSVGDVVLADGAVVAAVNGVASLHGTTILVDRPVMLDESDRIARLSWERFDRVPVGETPWFSPRPYLGRSLGVSLTADAAGFGTNDLMVEAIRRPDALAINLRNHVPGLAAITTVRLFGVDGAPRPDWIEGDGKGGFRGRPPAGTGLVRVELEIELEDGRVVRRPLSVDAETGEIRALPPARPAGDPKPLGAGAPEPASRPEAPLFTAQLASLGGRGAHDLALIEKALTRGR